MWLLAFQETKNNVMCTWYNLMWYKCHWYNLMWYNCHWFGTGWWFSPDMPLSSYNKNYHEYNKLYSKYAVQHP